MPITASMRPEFQPRCRVRYRFSVEVNSYETANRLAVVEYIVEAFARQPDMLLHDAHAQHARQADWSPPNAFIFREERR